MYIIAEVGSNWYKPGDKFKNAVDQIIAAKRCGAHAVKFQYFTTEEVGADPKYCIPKDWIRKLAITCRDRDIDFLCSAFSLEGFRRVDPYVRMHKLASSEISDKTIVCWLRRQSKPVIFSLGCATDFDIPAFDYGHPLFCISQYPADWWQYPFDQFAELSRRGTRTRWGVSDHTMDSTVAKMATYFGANFIERHVDLTSPASESPDHVVSMGYKHFKDYVADIKSYEPFDEIQRFEIGKKIRKVWHEKSQSYKRPYLCK